MPVNVARLIEVLAEISQEKDLKVAATESLKGGLVTGACATVGGLIFGPLGLALGGAIGGAIAAQSSNGKFRSVAQILKNMSPRQKESLCNKIHKVFSEIGYEDVRNLTMLILSSASFKELALKEVINFLNKEMNLSILPC